MSFQNGNTRVAEAVLPELELSKETLQDLDVEGINVKGGAGIVAQAPVAGGAQPLNPGVIRATIATSGTSVI